MQELQRGPDIFFGYIRIIVDYLLKGLAGCKVAENITDQNARFSYYGLAVTHGGIY